MGGVTDHLTLEVSGALVLPFGFCNTDMLIHTIADKYSDLTPRDLGLQLGPLVGEAGLDDLLCVNA